MLTLVVRGVDYSTRPNQVKGVAVEGFVTPDEYVIVFPDRECQQPTMFPRRRIL